MTWTCEKCKVTAYDPACWKCGDPRPAGLSEEERAVLPRIRQWAGDMCANGGLSAGRSEMLVRRAAEDFSEATKAARSPLEAENRRLEARVKELQAQLSEAQKHAAPLTTGWKRAVLNALSRAREILPEVKPDECDGRCSSTCDDCRRCRVEVAIEEIAEAVKAVKAIGDGGKPAAPTVEKTGVRPGIYRLRWKYGGASVASVGRDFSGRNWFAPTNWISVPSFDWNAVESFECTEEAKPAVPAGLPEVGEPVEALACGRRTSKVKRHLPSGVEFELEDGGVFRMRDERETWHRLPPAQMRQEPAAPVEVTTKNLDRYLQNVTLAHALPNRLREFVACDISENMESLQTRHTERIIGLGGELHDARKERDQAIEEIRKDKARIAELSGERDAIRRDAAKLASDLGEVDKRRAQAEAEASDFCAKYNGMTGVASSLRKKRDAALAEVERLKGELAAAKGARG